MKPVLLYHGTTATHRASIAQSGLVAPWADRGVSLALDPAYARQVARVAVLRERVARDGDEPSGEGLVVVVAGSDVEVLPVGGLFDPSPSYVVDRVPPGRVVEMLSLRVILPPPGSRRERALLSSGYASVAAGSSAEPTLALARQIRDVGDAIADGRRWGRERGLAWVRALGLPLPA